MLRISISKQSSAFGGIVMKVVKNEHWTIWMDNNAHAYTLYIHHTHTHARTRIC